MRVLFAALFCLCVATAGIAVAAPAFTPYSSSTFSSAISSGDPVLVHVHADWCSVCRRQIQILETLMQEPGFESIKAVRINFDLDRDIVSKLSVRSQSTVIVVVDGEIASASAFETDPERLRQQILTSF